MENATSFGAQADIYAAARPSYPQELFDWIKTNSPALDKVWDVGSGSGQAARSLSQIFKHVHATDIDQAQIAQAQSLKGNSKNISYAARPAHSSGLADNSVDAITVATALHWFDFSKFWPEVIRAARPNALFCAWTYHRVQAQPDIEDTILAPTLDILEPYWHDGNRLSWRGYPADEVGMPFNEIDTPDFTLELRWTPAQLIGFARSWSAHKKARLDGHEAELAAAETAALRDLGHEPRTLYLPLNMLAGHVA